MLEKKKKMSSLTEECITLVKSILFEKNLAIHFNLEDHENEHIFIYKKASG